MNRKKIITHSKLGLPRSRQPVKATVGSYLRMANAGKSKRKPGMPKMPWEEKR